MKTKKNPELIHFVQDVDKTIEVMRDAAQRIIELGKTPSKWWDIKNLNRAFLMNYAKESEFYVGLVNGKPAVAAILQFNQNAQEWSKIDKGKKVSALYIHWLCVHRNFAGRNLSKTMIDFAEILARKNKVGFLRVDTNAEEIKLREVYEKLGFSLIKILQEDYRKTAFYERKI